MKLLELKIEGFRSLRNVVWKPGDLNVLIGPNAGGKSNLLKAMELLAAAANDRLGDHVQREGGLGAIVWDGQASPITFTLTAGPVENGLSRRTAEERVEYVLELARLGQTSEFRIEREELRAGSGDLARAHPEVLRLPPSKNSRTGPRTGNRRPGTSRLSGQQELRLALMASRAARSLGLAELVEFLPSWGIYQQLRTDQQSPVRQPAVSRLETAVEGDGSNLVSVLHTLYSSDQQFEERVNDGMSAAFGNEFDKMVFPPDAGDQRIQLRARWRHLRRDCSVSELSDGTLRFLFLLVILANPYPPPLIAIDEPETGLHPSMLGIVAEFAAEAATRTQVVLTTHSAEFLDGFSELALQPTACVVESQDGETEIKPIGDEKLAYWLKHYKLGELYRTNTLETMP